MWTVLINKKYNLMFYISSFTCKTYYCQEENIRLDLKGLSFAIVGKESTETLYIGAA